MKVVVDVNLTPQWAAFLSTQGHEAVAYSEVGDPRDSDERIAAWAREHDHVILTNDRGFGQSLHASRAN